MNSELSYWEKELILMFGKVPDEYYDPKLQYIFLYTDYYTDPSTHQPENSIELYTKAEIIDRLNFYYESTNKSPVKAVDEQTKLKEQEEDDKIIQSIYAIYKRVPKTGFVKPTHEKLKIIEQKLIDAGNHIEEDMKGCYIIDDEFKFQNLEESSSFLKKMARNPDYREGYFPYPFDEKNNGFYFDTPEE